MSINAAALRWKYGLPGCTITVVDDTVAEWDGCSIGSPSAGEIATAEADYADYLEEMALGDTIPGQWYGWRNDDMDTGAEILVEWDAPARNAAWSIQGQISKGENVIAILAHLSLRVTTDAYGDPVRTVTLSVQHTAPPSGASVADVAWVDGEDVLYSDYDETSGKIRLRANLASDSWRAQGEWQRLNRLAEFESAA